MSLVVFAGSSQLASLPLLAVAAPMWVLWLTAFVVNLRFVIYSAQWRVYVEHLSRSRRLLFGYFAADLNLIVFQRAYPRPVPEPGQMPYFVGGAVTIWPAW